MTPHGLEHDGTRLLKGKPPHRKYPAGGGIVLPPILILIVPPVLIDLFSRRAVQGTEVAAPLELAEQISSLTCGVSRSRPRHFSRRILPVIKGRGPVFGYQSSKRMR
jgi:hypothetical protein